MKRYLLRRLLVMIPTLFGIIMITFFIIRLAPGNPVQAMTGGVAKRTSIETYQALMKEYGLDKPLVVQFFSWAARSVMLDFGESYTYKKPVTSLILEKLPVTLYLNIISTVLIFSISLSAGVRSAVNKDGWFDRLSGTLFFILYSLFVPWVAVSLITIFSVKLNVFPLLGITSIDFIDMPWWRKPIDILWHSVLPVLVMSYSGFAYLSRIVRSSMLEVLGQEYILAARSKGLSEKTVLYRHGLRNALIPLVTIFGSLLPGLIGGSVIIERIFSIDGMGNLFFSSVLARDYPVIMGLSTISALLTLAGILVSDVLYAAVDPRIRLE